MMPPEPDNKIEELLRGYARKRRQDADSPPPELHPANRRALQAEAAKLVPRAPRRSSLWTLLVGSWPRIAISTGVFAILALILWNSVPTRDDVASADSKGSAERARPEPAERAPMTLAFENRSEPVEGRDHELKLADAGKIDAAQTELATRKDADRPTRGIPMSPFLEKKSSDPSAGTVELRSYAKAEAANGSPNSIEDLKKRYTVVSPLTVVTGVDANSRNLTKLKAFDQSGAAAEKPNFTFGGGGGANRQQDVAKEGLAKQAPTAGAGLGGNSPAGGSGPGREIAQFAKSADHTVKDNASKANSPNVNGPIGGALSSQSQTQTKLAETEMLLARDESVRSKQYTATAPASSLTIPTPPPPTLIPQPTRGRPPITATAAPGAPAGRTDTTSISASVAVSGQKAESQANVVRLVWRARYARQPENAAALPVGPVSSPGVPLQKEQEQAATATSPLSTFEFEQSGDEIRVIDQDGSVYAGRVVTARPEPAERAADKSEARFGEADFDTNDKLVRQEAQQFRTPVPALSQSKADPQSARRLASVISAANTTNVLFRVVGTNRTLGQRVMFEGTFSSLPSHYQYGFANGARPEPVERARPEPGAAPTPTPAPTRARPSATTPVPAATQTQTKMQTPTRGFADSYSTNLPKSPQLVGRMRLGLSNAPAISIIAYPAPAPK